MKLSNIVIILSFLALLAFSSCKNGVIKLPPSQGDELFADEAKLIGQYIDTIKHSPDSAALFASIDRFESQLTAINLKYTARADGEMSQGQNDTICMLTDSLLKIKKERLKYFKNRLLPQSDSLAVPPLLGAPVQNKAATSAGSVAHEVTKRTELSSTPGAPQ